MSFPIYQRIVVSRLPLSEARESKPVQQGREISGSSHLITSIINSLGSGAFSSPQEFLALNFFKDRRTFCGNRKGSPAMGEPDTTRYRANSAIDYKILCFMGRVGFEPARSITPVDFK